MQLSVRRLKALPLEAAARVTARGCRLHRVAGLGVGSLLGAGGAGFRRAGESITRSGCPPQEEAGKALAPFWGRLCTSRHRHCPCAACMMRSRVPGSSRYVGLHLAHDRYPATRS